MWADVQNTERTLSKILIKEETKNLQNDSIMKIQILVLCEPQQNIVVLNHPLTRKLK